MASIGYDDVALQKQMSQSVSGLNTALQDQGKYVKGTSLSWENMSTQIGKSTIKVGFLLVATTAVLGAIRKVQDTLQTWKELEIT